MWNSQQNKIAVYGVIGFCTVFYFFDNLKSNSITIDHSTKDDSKLSTSTTSDRSTTTSAFENKKTILFWNSYWHWSHFQMGVGNRGFAKCSNTNCYTTTRRSKLQNPLEIIHAIIFHGVGLKKEDVIKLRALRHLIPSWNQGVNPIFILFMLVSTYTASKKSLTTCLCMI